MGFKLKLAAVLVVVWILVMILVQVGGCTKVTPDETIAFLEVEQGSFEDEATRREVALQLADRMNRMEFLERAKVRRSPQFESLIQSMSRDEVGDFIDATLPQGFNALISGFNKLTVVQRQEIVDRAVEEIRARDRQNTRELDPEYLEKLTRVGLKTFYVEASAKTKLDLAPLLDELQSSAAGPAVLEEMVRRAGAEQ